LDWEIWKLKNFRTDTKDAIEKLYQSAILTNFPNYAVFWNKFIGVKISKKGKLLPYGLKFPAGILANQKKSISSNYRELTMTHYSLFVHLAGVHYQLAELKKTPIKKSRQSYFKHFENFETCYMHLGIVFDLLYHLWDIMFDLRGIGRNNARRNLERFLTNKHKKYLWVEFKKLNNNSIVLRNNITHFARVASIISNGECFVPEITKKNINWEKQWNFRNWKNTTIKTDQDLNNCETTLNELHSVLITEFSDYLNSLGIVIKY
jgi:hypothetical protein